MILHRDVPSAPVITQQLQRLHRVTPHTESFNFIYHTFKKVNHTIQMSFLTQTRPSTRPRTRSSAAPPPGTPLPPPDSGPLGPLCG